MLEQGKVITFWSPRGNTGCTFNAINLAKRLNDTKGKTVLLDLNLKSARITDYLLLQDSGHNIDSLFSYVVGNNLTKEIVQANIEYKEDLPILKGAINTQQAEYIKIENIDPIVNTLKDMYSYIIVDCSSLINNAGTYIALKEADVVISLLTKDIITTMALNDIKPLLFANFREDKFKFFINFDSDKVFMPISEMSKYLDIDIVGSIPKLHDGIINYINKGQIMKWTSSKDREALAYISAIDSIIIKYILLNENEKLKNKRRNKLFGFLKK